MIPNIHLVYPSSSSNSTPYVIGRKISEYLTEVGYRVINYDWNSCIKPKPLLGDILIGHAHPNPYTSFRLGMKNKFFSKKILLQPFSGDPCSYAYLESCLPYITFFAMITGKYWFNNLPDRYRDFSDGLMQLDLAVDPAIYRSIKTTFSKPGKRKFLYIGNNDPCKNLKLLELACAKFRNPIEKFTGIGTGYLKGARMCGTLELTSTKGLEEIAAHDFLVMTSRYDANPTVVLEAMSLGLIPLLLPTCGYVEKDGPLILSAIDNPVMLHRLLASLDRVDTSYLFGLQTRNYHIIRDAFTWPIFLGKLHSIVLNSPNESFSSAYGITSRFSFHRQIMATNFYLRRSNLLSYLRANFLKSTSQLSAS